MASRGAWSAPGKDSALPETTDKATTQSGSSTAKDESERVDALEEYNLLSTPPPSPLPPGASATLYYPYRKSLSPMVGFVLTTKTDTPFTYVAGISYLWPRFRSPQAEIGADIMGEYGGHVHFSVRHIYLERSYFRPYLLWGLTHEVSARDGFASPLDWDNYYVHAACGFEDVIRLPQSARLEIRALAGPEKQMLILSLGGSWGW